MRRIYFLFLAKFLLILKVLDTNYYDLVSYKFLRRNLEHQIDDSSVALSEMPEEAAMHSASPSLPSTEHAYPYYTVWYCPVKYVPVRSSVSDSSTSGRAEPLLLKWCGAPHYIP